MCQSTAWNLFDSELTQDKCYRGGVVDEVFTDSLTQVRGYPSNEHESIRQTRVPGPPARPLQPGRSSSQDAHPRRVLRHLRLSSQERLAPAAPAAGGAHNSRPAWSQTHLRSA